MCSSACISARSTSGASSICGRSTSCAASAWSKGTCGVDIGALATFTDIIKSALVQRRVPMLAAAAREVGGAQIQNRGTLGGNIANASPAGDTLPVLAAANARIVLRSAGGERVVPFNDFYTGYRTSVRQPSELITAIEIPPIDGRQWWRKVGTRRAQAISKVMMAGVRGREVRVAIGSVAPTVLHADRGRRCTLERRIDRRRAGGAQGRDRADRRHPIDRRLSPAGGGESVGGVLERDRAVMLSASMVLAAVDASELTSGRSMRTP